MRNGIPPAIRKTAAPIGRFFARDTPGLLLLMVGTLALLWPRMRRAETFWLDEMFSVLMANRTPVDIVGITQLDVHPPLFYFLLKAWMKAFRVFGVEPGVVEVRLFGVVVFLLFLCAFWFLLRRLLGRSIGSLAAILLAMSPVMGGYAAEVRQYALIIPMACACWLILCRMAWRERIVELPPSARERLAMWGLYAVLGSMMLWMQLISGIVLFWLGILWIALLPMRGRRRWAFFRGGAIAQVAVVASIVPWIPAARRNLQFPEESVLWWMTEANTVNAWGTFFFYGIYGKVGTFEIHLHWGHLLMGIGSVVLPLILLPAAMFAARKRIGPSPQLLLGISGIGVGSAVILSMFFLSYFEVVKVFHGPRYPMIAVPMLLVGIVSLGAWSFSRCGRSPHWVWMLCVLMLFNFARAHHWFVGNVVEGPAGDMMVMEADLFPPPDVPVYVYPNALHAIFAPSIPHESVLPISEIANHPPDQQHIMIFMIDLWRHVDHPDMVSFRAALNRLSLSKYYEQEALYGGGALVVMAHPNTQNLERFTRLPWYRAARLEVDDYPSIAVPEMQRARDGWGVLQMDEQGSVFVDAQRERVALRFDGSLRPGAYQLQLIGHNPPYPKEPAEFRLELEGTEEPITLSLEAGAFGEWIDVELIRGVREPTLVIERETYIPAEATDYSESQRPASFIFYEAWLRPAEE